jgi:hypothetical protein
MQSHFIVAMPLHLHHKYTQQRQQLRPLHCRSHHWARPQYLQTPSGPMDWLAASLIKPISVLKVESIVEAASCRFVCRKVAL